MNKKPNTPIAKMTPVTKVEVRFDGEQIRILSESDIILGDGTSTAAIDSELVRQAIAAIEHPDFDVKVLNYEPCSTYLRNEEFSQHLLSAIVKIGIAMCLKVVASEADCAAKVADEARREKVNQLMAQKIVVDGLINQLTTKKEKHEKDK